MSANKLIKDPFGTILVAALLAAMVCFFVFMQSGEAAPAADNQPSAAKASYQTIGGKPVPDGKYPFMVFLDISYKNDRNDYSSRHACGGTLIDKDSVLTAGHCFYDGETGESLFEDKFTVAVDAYIGRTVRSNRSQGQVRNVDLIIIHGAYKGIRALNGSNDVAVLRLSRSVSGIKPIKLATSKQNNLESPGRDATVAGWGNTIAQLDVGVAGGPEYPDRMQEAQVPIVSDARADKAWEKSGSPNQPALEYLPPLMVAAGEKDKGGCHGDSGGPLFSALESDGGKYTQIGIVSKGATMCGDKENNPDIYTEVNASSIRSFITYAASK